MTEYAEITLGGQVRPIRFGYAALALFGELTGLALADMTEQQLGRFDRMLCLVWCALKSGARKAKQPSDFTPEDVADWFDDAPEQLQEAMRLFTESMAATKKKETTLADMTPANQ